MKRGRRPLSDEDRQLWDHVRRTAEPLRTAPPEPVPPAPPQPAPPATSPPSGPPPPAVASAKREKPKPPPGALVPLGGLDRKTLTRLGRGSIAIDARIDLHGMTQDAANHRLLRFLEAARGEGARIVLVITGKGAPDGPEFGSAGRGVLRRAVPAWLASPAFRLHVSGYESAGRRHGGEGALYVRLRRKGTHEVG
jgi:DNA-nicking Smr family endonuclease